MIFQDFLSPKQCDAILDQVRLVAPNLDKEGNPAKMERFHNDAEDQIFDKFQPLIPQIEAHYDLKHKGTERLLFQCFPEGMATIAEAPHCESSAMVRKKWVKVRDRDLTGILWLKDHQHEPPLDLKTEVYGGKLEFPIYNFSLQPQRGTLVLYPAGPHFITATSQVLVGDLYAVRFHIAADGIWIYQPSNFPGNYVEWFAEHA
jgi:hypothetical protein